MTFLRKGSLVSRALNCTEQTQHKYILICSCTSCSETGGLHRADPAQIYSDLLLHIMFRDWRQSLKKMNAKITKHNESNTEALVLLFQDREFITGLALMIGAACFSEQGIACCFV
jgi:hypothetical protein